MQPGHQCAPKGGRQSQPGYTDQRSSYAPYKTETGGNGYVACQSGGIHSCASRQQAAKRHKVCHLCRRQPLMQGEHFMLKQCLCTGATAYAEQPDLKEAKEKENENKHNL